MKGGFFVLLVLSQVWDVAALVSQVPDKCSRLVLNYGSRSLDYPVRSSYGGMTRYNGNSMNDYNMDGYLPNDYSRNWHRDPTYNYRSQSRGPYSRNYYDQDYTRLNSQGAYSRDYTTSDGRFPAFGSNSYYDRYNQGYNNYPMRRGSHDMYDRGNSYGRRNYGYGMYNDYDTNSAYGRSYGGRSSYGYGNGPDNYGYGRRNSYYGGRDYNYGMGVGVRRPMNGYY